MQGVGSTKATSRPRRQRVVRLRRLIALGFAVGRSTSFHLHFTLHTLAPFAIEEKLIIFGRKTMHVDKLFAIERDESSSSLLCAMSQLSRFCTYRAAVG